MVVRKNGKEYFVSEIIKKNSRTIDCSKLFSDIEEFIKKNNITKSGYGSSLKYFYDRFAGTYFSPSFMKTFEANPANAILGNFATETLSDATAIGTIYHKIMEEYYLQPKELRDRNQLYELEKQIIPEGMDFDRVHQYVEGYKTIKDYIDESKELDDTKLDCYCEQRGRMKIEIPKFEITLPIETSLIVDRVDVRDDKLFILDYKTGRQGPHSATFDGYLGSMILYKWAMEQQYRLPVAGGYLVSPHLDNKYIPLDFSLVNESKFIDAFQSFYKNFKESANTRLYEFTNKGYFTSPEMKKYREIMNTGDLEEKIPVEFYLGEAEEELPW